jgi:hypothetical protein
MPIEGQKADAQQVYDFFMVNMGRPPTPYEVEYYTGRERFDQLVRDTGQYRGSTTPSQSAWYGPEGASPFTGSTVQRRPEEEEQVPLRPGGIPRNTSGGMRRS